MSETDLEKGNVDELSITPAPRSTSMTMGLRTHTVSSNLSTRSLLHRPIDLFKRFTAHGRQNSWGVQSRINDISTQQDFLLVLTEGGKESRTLASAGIWYISYLKGKLEEYPEPLFQQGAALRNRRVPMSLTNALFVVLTFVAKQLSITNNLSLAQIVNELVNENIIHEDPLADDERAALFQFAFILIGWLCMLYNPGTGPGKNQLFAQKYYYSSAGSKNPTKSRTFENDHQDFNNNDHPLYTMLGRFGTLIPEASSRIADSFAPSSDWITVPFVCYHTLRKVCRIQVVWVDNIAMHLEFDSAGKMLKVFRFPSFARLHFRSKGRTILSQLFDDNAKDITGETPSDSNSTAKYFREVLLTYRLIFGQDNESWRLFSKEMERLSKSERPNLFTLEGADPLLRTLCGESCDSQAAAGLYEDILADGVQPYYTANSFPHFSKRLLMLQGYVREQHPHNWKTLWYDHRDKANWWQFWAVLFIGGGTIILSILTLVFQIWQVALSQKQLVASSK